MIPKTQHGTSADPYCIHPGMLRCGMLVCSEVDQERVAFPANWLTAHFCRSVMLVYREPMYGRAKKVSVRNPDGRNSGLADCSLRKY